MGCSLAATATVQVSANASGSTPAIPSSLQATYQSVIAAIVLYQQQIQTFVGILTSQGWDPCNYEAAMATLRSQGITSASGLEEEYDQITTALDDVVAMIEDINRTSYTGGYVGSQMGFSATGSSSSGQVVVTNSITGYTATISCSG